MRIAELQALRFLELSGVTCGPVPEDIIADLPRVQVERMSPLPVSGATHWASQRWLIVLNGAEPATRQRFSLAHEFKHILDHRFMDVLYRNVPEAARHDAIEQVCDYFAGCLLIPRPWLKKAWGNRVQTLDGLAARFETSQAAMSVRLQQVGLAKQAPRCVNDSAGWALPGLVPALDTWTYRRASSLVGAI